MFAPRAGLDVFQAQQTQMERFASYSRIVVDLFPDNYPASVALYVWDILINLQREKEFIWDKKFKASTLLYFMARYPLIARSIFQIAFTLETPQLRPMDEIHVLFRYFSSTYRYLGPHALGRFLTFTSLVVSWKLVRIIGVARGLKNVGSENTCVSVLLMRSGVLYFVQVLSMLSRGKRDNDNDIAV
ncbi:hypothetical protein BU17DRAFT_63806 [Hysterangium stoloniferum]|nr:hypothetical protein BU17DRAFT_63806 [Hysterangium stoloniferum]